MSESINVTRSNVIRRVSLDQAYDGTDGSMQSVADAHQKFGNIIHFYNVIFVQAMKQIVLGFKSGADSRVSASPLQHALPQPTKRSGKRRVVAGSNVYVSSSSPQLAAHPTPRTRALRCEISIGAIGASPAGIRLANQALKLKRKLNEDTMQGEMPAPDSAMSKRFRKMHADVQKRTLQ